MAAEAANLGAVKLTQELRRVEALPRRLWDDEPDDLTELLRTPEGTMSLRQIQAVALSEIADLGGMFGPLRVGAGKTLISLLAPVVTFADRPLLLVPAGLIEKTKNAMAPLCVVCLRSFPLPDTECQGCREHLAPHWDLPRFVRIMSYEWLGRAQAAGALTDYEPDLIVADECHRLKNLQAACTRRVKRHMQAFLDTKFVAMSGTVTKRSILDYTHILRWCLDSPPIPKAYTELEAWADALDERKGQTKRADPGALRVLCNDEEDTLWKTEPRRAARLAYRRRLVETPGVVATKETPIDASITMRAVEAPESNEVDEAFHGLRSLWETPDGWPIADGLAMFRHARELALGFFYVWDPRPPMPWLEARRAWCAYVRKVLKHSRKLDSESQVRSYVQKQLEGRTITEGPELLLAWLEVRDTFEPNTVPVWIDDSVIDLCAEWLDRTGGIAWTEHRCFAERLAEKSGYDYYGRKGLNAERQPIEAADPKMPLIASIASNSTGRNLQAWHKNLIASMPANGMQTEQLMGRTHRDGQTADEVTFDVLVTCAEHVGAFWQAKRDSEFVFDSTGSPQKILVADIDVPTATDLAYRSGARWDK